jgi:SAM-dependent methyltransferase
MKKKSFVAGIIILVFICLFMGYFLGRIIGGEGQCDTKVANDTKVSFGPSPLANKYLSQMRGIEIGGSEHNQFYLNTLNVDFTSDETIYTKEQLVLSGKVLKVDIVALGDDLPFKDNTLDFVINSHVLEHFYDPIKAIKEWLRVIRPGGYLFMIIPHKERTFDKDKPRTTLKELIDRHSGKNPLLSLDHHGHYSYWITEDLLELCRYLNLNVVEFQDVDDKVGNGFSIVIKKSSTEN